MGLYDAAQVRHIKQTHLEYKKSGSPADRQYALQQYKEWIAAIANPALRPLFKRQPYGAALLLALSVVGWLALMSPVFAIGLLLWGLISWNMALLLTAVIFLAQYLVLALVQTALNNELGARIQYLVDQGVAMARQADGEEHR